MNSDTAAPIEIGIDEKGRLKLIGGQGWISFSIDADSVSHNDNEADFSYLDGPSFSAIINKQNHCFIVMVAPHRDFVGGDQFGTYQANRIGLWLKFDPETGKLLHA